MDPVQTYTPLAIIAVAVTLLIQLLKSDKIPITIPPRFQPLAAVVFSLIAMISTRIAQGLPVGRAVFEGLLAAMGAVGIFEASSSITKPPSDPPAPKPPSSALPPDDPYRQSGNGALRVALSLLFALVAFGCGAVEKVQHVVQMSSEVIARAEPCLVVQYEMQQEACLEKPSDEERRACVDRVKATWKPIVDALVELRTVRCEIEPAKCEAQR